MSPPSPCGDADLGEILVREGATVNDGGSGGPEPLSAAQRLEIGPLATGGHGNDFGVGTLPPEIEHHLQAIFVGHEDVQKNDVGGILPAQRHARIPVLSLDHLMPRSLQGLPEDLAKTRVVVHHQNACHPWSFLPTCATKGDVTFPAETVA
jgi:hypothetical protein